MIKSSIKFLSIASKQLSSLKPIIEKLRSVHDAYNNAELRGGDCSFWYTERPHIGFLAAAVWLYGETALEEYAAVKQKRRGRGDLRFRIRKTYFHCEAKRVFFTFRDVAKATERARDGLEKAIKDAKCGKPEKDDRVLALCFVTPRFPEARRDLLNDQLCKWIDSVRDNRLCHALVWIELPEGEKRFCDNGWLYPGFLLAVSEVPNRRRVKRS